MIVRHLAFGTTLALALLVACVRLGTPSWHMDELTFRDAGVAYLHGDFTPCREHPPLGQYLYGLAATVGGPRPGVVRLPAALAGVGTGLVLFVFGRRVAGFWAGLAAFAVFTLVPCTASMTGVAVMPIRLTRAAMLDPIMGFFMTLALWLGWRWREDGGVGRAAGAGFVVGLAAMTKVPGGLVAPVILGAALARRGSRAAGECVAFGVAALASVAAAYAPFGSKALGALRYMVDFQSAHRVAGHPVIVAGTFYLHPPWWALPWWYWQGSGTAVAVGLAGAVAASFVAVAPAVRWYLLAAAGVLFAFLAGAGVALAHYVLDWQAPVALLAGLSLVGLGRRGGAYRVVGVALGVLLAASVVTTAARLARLVPADYRLAGKTLIASGLGRATVVSFGYDNVLRAYLPEATLLDAANHGAGEADVIVLDPLWGSRFATPGAVAQLRAALPAFAECPFDRLRVYVRVVPPRTALARRCTRPAALPPPTPGSPTGL